MKKTLVIITLFATVISTSACNQKSKKNISETGNVNNQQRPQKPSKEEHEARMNEIYTKLKLSDTQISDMKNSNQRKLKSIKEAGLNNSQNREAVRFDIDKINEVHLQEAKEILSSNQCP